MGSPSETGDRASATQGVATTSYPDGRERLAATGEIATQIAHELRNRLQMISATVYLAKRDPASSMPHLASIERSARAAHAIVDDLMALARGEPANAESVPLAAVLEGAREALPEPHPTFEDALTPPDLEVRAHPRLLARLFHVLYENAVGASIPQRVTIATRARLGPSGVVVEVSDDGPGVPTEIAATLFEPLVSLREGGTGLGLALARRVVHAHAGTIALVPSPRGATFRVELPR